MTGYEAKKYRPDLTFPEAWEVLNALSRQRALLEKLGHTRETSDVMRHTSDAEAKLRGVVFPITPEMSESEQRFAWGDR